MVFMSLSLTGCKSAMDLRPEGKKINRSDVVSMKPGATTRESVLSLFGNPDSSIKDGDQETLVYVYKEKRVPTYAGGLIENRMLARTVKTTLEIVLKDDKLFSYRYTNTED